MMTKPIVFQGNFKIHQRRDSSFRKDITPFRIDNLGTVRDSTSIAQIIDQYNTGIRLAYFFAQPTSRDEIFLHVLTLEKDTFVPRRHWNTMRKNENCDRSACFQNLLDQNLGLTLIRSLVNSDPTMKVIRQRSIETHHERDLASTGENFVGFHQIVEGTCCCSRDRIRLCIGWHNKYSMSQPPKNTVHLVR